jgi:hypothetical protein
MNTLVYLTGAGRHPQWRLLLRRQQLRPAHRRHRNPPGQRLRRRRCHLLRGRQWTGAPTVENSDLHGTPSSEFQNAPGIFDSLDGHDVQPTAIDSTLS